MLVLINNISFGEAKWDNYLHLLFSLLLLKMSQQCNAGREWEYFINSKTPNPHSQGENSRRQNERQDLIIKKSLALLLKPFGPTTSNTWSLSSIRRDTYRRTKVLRDWVVLLQGGADEKRKERKNVYSN